MFAKGGGGHGTCDAHFPLAAYIRTGDGGIFLVKNPDGSRGEEKSQDSPGLLTGLAKSVGVMHDGRNDAGGSIGRRGDDPPASGILLVHRERIQIDPIQRAESIPQSAFGMREQLLMNHPGAAFHLESAGKLPLGIASSLDACLHGIPDFLQSGPRSLLGSPG